MLLESPAGPLNLPRIFHEMTRIAHEEFAGLFKDLAGSGLNGYHLPTERLTPAR